MKEIELKKQLPVVTMNFEEVKASLIETTEKYKNFIVTEEGLKDCKATQKELAGVRNKIDSYRKDVKKEMELPIKAFETQCKELIGLIADAEQPIKDGILVFDNKRREEKKNKALEIIQEAVQAYELNEKYASKLTLLDKYTVLTGSIKSIKDDVELRATSLKKYQDIEEKQMAERKATIETTLESANLNINAKLKIEDFERYINSNVALPVILQEINSRAEMIRKAENPPVESKEEVKQETKEEIKEDPKVEVKEEPIPTIQSQVIKEEPIYFINMVVKGNMNKITALSKFLKDNGHEYSVNDKGRC